MATLRELIDAIEFEAENLSANQDTRLERPFIKFLLDHYSCQAIYEKMAMESRMDMQYNSAMHSKLELDVVDGVASIPLAEFDFPGTGGIYMLSVTAPDGIEDTLQEIDPIEARTISRLPFQKLSYYQIAEKIYLVPKTSLKKVNAVVAGAGLGVNDKGEFDLDVEYPLPNELVATVTQQVVNRLLDRLEKSADVANNQRDDQ